MNRLIIAVAAIVLLSSCQGDDDSDDLVESTSPTLASSPARSLAPTTSAPTATPVVTVSPSPVASVPAGMDAFQAFALEIDQAVAEHNSQFFLDHAEEVEFTCTGDEVGGQCAGQPAGAVFHGIPGAAWKSDASAFFSAEDYRANLDRYFNAAMDSEIDQYGPGTIRLYALASKAGPETTEYLAITTAIVDIYPSTDYPIGRNEREAHAFRFRENGGDWAFVGEWAAGTLVVSVDWLSGICTQCYDYWESWED